MTVALLQPVWQDVANAMAALHAIQSPSTAALPADKAEEEVVKEPAGETRGVAALKRKLKERKSLWQSHAVESKTLLSAWVGASGAWVGATGVSAKDSQCVRVCVRPFQIVKLQIITGVRCMYNWLNPGRFHIWVDVSRAVLNIHLYKGMLYNPFVPLGENDGINILYC